MDSESLARLWRQLHPGGNPLVRRWDRAESRLLVSVAVLALLTVPILATIGSNVFTQQLAVAAEQQASRSAVAAVLLEDAPAVNRMVRGSPDTVEVRASWVSVSGIRQEGKVPAPYGAVKDTKVDVWLDSNGDPALPPLTHREAATIAICTAVGVWLALVFALVGAFVGVACTVESRPIRRLGP